MTIIAPSPKLKFGRQPLKVASTVRIVPAPKTFTLSVTWEETAQHPILIPVQLNPASRERSDAVDSGIRRNTPLKFRLGPLL